MKNMISYYYNINPTSIHHNANTYKFVINDDRYIFIKTDLPLERIDGCYRISILLRKHNIYSHMIVLNIENTPFTIINNNCYVLLKVMIDDYLLILEDIINFNDRCKKLKMNKKIEWYDLWTKKIDYIEYQINQFGKKYPLVRESIDYFIGLSEMAISLLNYIDFSKVNISVQHKRISNGYTSDDYYNPLNFVIDSITRDSAEYFKANMFINRNIFDDIKYYIDYSDMNEEDLKLFFVRMLFPTYYFDMYEKVLNGTFDEKRIMKIISNIDQYQDILVDIYYYIKQYVELPNIDWYQKM